MAETPSIQSLQFCSPKSSATILIVEDDPGLRYLLAQCLHKGNYQVVTISSENEVLRSLAEQPIDLVLFDPILPTMGPNKGQLRICQSICRQYAGFGSYRSSGEKHLFFSGRSSHFTYSPI